MSWDDLRFFLAAARAGSLAGAARALSVEHSTVGRRLGALEAQLGAPVVIRTPAGLELTSLGARLVPLAESMDRDARAVAALTSPERVRVRLALPSGMSALVVGDLTQLRRHRPEIGLEIVSGSRPVDLARGEADLAVRVGPISDPDLIVKNLGTVAIAAYASRTYLRRRPVDRLDDADIGLAGHDLVAFDAALAATPGARWLEARATGATVVLRSREMTDMLTAIAGGLGLGLLPCFLGDGDPALERLTRQPVAASRLSLVYRREARRARGVQVAARFIAATLERQVARLTGRRG